MERVSGQRFWGVSAVMSPLFHPVHIAVVFACQPVCQPGTGVVHSSRNRKANGVKAFCEKKVADLVL